MAINLSSTPTDNVERVELFSIDDVSYTIPKKVRVNLQLKYLHALKTEGELAATYVMLQELLGADGYNALMGYDELTDEDFQQVVQVASEIVLGSAESGKA